MAKFTAFAEVSVNSYSDVEFLPDPPESARAEVLAAILTDVGAQITPYLDRGDELAGTVVFGDTEYRWTAIATDAYADGMDLTVLEEADNCVDA